MVRNILIQLLWTVRPNAVYLLSSQFNTNVPYDVPYDREKTQVEDAFKNIKSFVKIRPFFVNTDEHVKAVYTICILSYFINRYLSEKRKETEDKNYLNSQQLYAPLKSGKLVTLLDTANGLIKKDVIPLSEEQKAILRIIVPEKAIKFKPIIQKAV